MVTARCPNCNSIWVCWNWIHRKTMWVHECWDCGDNWGGHCFETPDKVANGIPYQALRRFYNLFHRGIDGNSY